MSERLQAVVDQLGIRPDHSVLGLFHREPDRAHALVDPWLAAGGSVRAFFDAPTRR